jgi:hypothetical protein
MKVTSTVRDEFVRIEFFIFYNGYLTKAKLYMLCNHSYQQTHYNVNISGKFT